MCEDKMITNGSCSRNHNQTNIFKPCFDPKTGELLFYNTKNKKSFFGFSKVACNLNYCMARGNHTF